MRQSISLKCVEGYIQFDTKDIVYIESDKHRSRLHISNGDLYHIYCKLNDLEDMLEEYGFIRVHKSYLVNKLHMKLLSNYKLLLDNNITVNVPRPRYNYVKMVLMENKTTKKVK